MDVLLFGDQTTDYLYTLQNLLKSHQGPVFNDFLDKVNVTLRQEITAVSKDIKTEIPSFSTIEELVSRYEASSDRNAILDSTLACLSQLIHFIIFFEDKHSTKYEVSDIGVIGVCTGLLAASAVASCDSLTTFTPLAIETVRIAFRVGLLIACRAKEISTQPSNASWSIVVTGVTEDVSKAHTEFLNKTHNLECARRVYISSIGPTTTTVSGPPSTLRLMFEQPNLFGITRSQAIPVRAPYHAPHIYAAAELPQLIPQTSTAVLKRYKVNASRIISVGNIKSASTLDLFQHCIHEILREPLMWMKVLDDCSKFQRISNSRLVPMGSSTYSNSMIVLLEQRLLHAKIEVNVSREKHSNIGQELSSSELSNNSKIAVVGMAGRFPNAANHEELWALLKKGFDTHRTIPPDRWDFQAHTDESGKGKNTSHTPYGCFIENPGHFDNHFFNISPREAAQIDPMQRLALVTAYEAIESSGMILNRTPSTQADRIATFYGQASDDWKETNSAQDIDTFFITGGIRAFCAGRINYHFGFQGPSYNIDTACSSSLAAIQLACTALKSKECDTVLAGGVNVFTNPDIFAGLSKGHFLSKTGPCKTFDNEADGYCRGEGVGTVILKRLADAIADKDPILGVITAAATNHSAEAVSITHPHIETQEALFRKVVRDARTNPCDISYVEMHGTGTQAGDSVEMESVTRVFAPQKKHRRKPDNPLYLGSVKSSVGHGEAVSGLTGLVKVLSMLGKDLIPPHCGIKTRMNQEFPADLAERNVHIPFEPLPWLRTDKGKRQVFLNNFGAAGGNTALLIEDAPLAKGLEIDPRARHIIALSGKTIPSFSCNVRQLLDSIEGSPSIDLPSMSYTMTARREHYKYRAAITASSQEELCVALRAVLEDTPVSPLKTPNVNFVFTGQGCQYLGMGRTLLQSSKSFRDEINNLDRISVSQGFPSFRSFIDWSPQDCLAEDSPTIVQLALVCLQIALARLWISWGIQPSAVIGHSLGEYAALNVAGVLSDYDVIYLVGIRARLLQAHCQSGTHSMLAVRGTLSSEELEMLSSEHGVEVACFNSPKDVVFSGPGPNIENLRHALSPTMKSQKLEVPFAFHSSQVEPILDEFESSASSIVFSTPKIPVISPLYARTIAKDHLFCPSYLRKHCREPVNFSGALQCHIENQNKDDYSTSMWLEIGPQPACCSMVKSTLDGSHKALYSLSKAQDPYTTLLQSLSTLYSTGMTIDWSEYHRDFESCVVVLPLPTYSFSQKNFWIDYKNNWTLNKGETPIDIPSVPPEVSTTSIQEVIRQDLKVKEGTAIVVARSDFAKPQLRAVVSGHLINGAGLCPSAIYADMAMTLSHYGHRLLRPTQEDIHMNVRDMTTSSPLIVDLCGTTAGPQVVEIEAKIDLSLGHAEVVIRSKTSAKEVEYARCLVSFESNSQWNTDWGRVEHLINSRLDALTHSLNVSKIQEGMAYRLFSNLVEYSPKYRGMREVLLDSEGLEATAQVCCRSTGKDGSFFLSPYLIDNLSHISGFVMNANDALDANHVYISHGWESMRFSKGLELGATYQVYVKMQPQPGSKMVAGDVYVLRNTNIIGVIGQCRFQCVPRSLLGTLLPSQQARVRTSPPVPEISQVPAMAQHSLEPSRNYKTSHTAHVTKPPEDITNRVFSILVDEIGCDSSELTHNTLFSDLGVDSLLSLAILGQLREVLGLDVDSTLLISCPTVGSLKRYLIETFESEKPEASILTPPRSPQRSNISPVKPDQILRADSTTSESRSLSILLQGSTKTANQNIFLLPDGSGSCSAYALLPPLSEDICLWGLNCPFMTSPEEFTIGVPAIVRIYLAEIRRRQPNGPYILGGWSAGGVLAYEATRQLLTNGETVSKLLLIDSPCPLGLEALPSAFHRFCADIGLLSSEAQMPRWLLPHFAATVRELTKYSDDLKAFFADEILTRMPKAVAIWALDGVGKEADKVLEWEGRMPNSMQWLVEDRSNLGPNGWELLLGEEQVRCLSVEGNHFTMMREPIIREVGQLLKRALKM